MTPITVLCYKKCTTCQKALKWLDAQGIAYTERPIKEENPSQEEMEDFIRNVIDRLDGVIMAECSVILSRIKDVKGLRL